jgi:hypothetical protein
MFPPFSPLALIFSITGDNLMPDQQRNEPLTDERTTLMSLVEQALNVRAVEELEWRQEPIHGGVGGGNADKARPRLERFYGTARLDGETRTWSLVRKTLLAGEVNHAPCNWFYWQREAEAYRSGWLSALPGNLRAPLCYRTEQPNEDTWWIWMEDLADLTGHKWSLDVYNAVAYHLGEFNGAYVDDTIRPRWPWLSANRFHNWDSNTTPAMERLPNLIEHPIVQGFYPREHVERLLHLWPNRQRYYTALDRLPQTLCHHDAFCRNLFPVQRDGDVVETVAIDWAFVGPGALGEEVSLLFFLAMLYYEFPAADAAALDEAIFTGYLDGLHAAGWRGDPNQVRLGYTVTMITRHAWPLLGHLVNWALTNVDVEARVSTLFGCSYAEYLDHRAVLYPVQLRLFEEALDLTENMRM